jgi:hypothetical protein
MMDGSAQRAPAAPGPGRVTGSADTDPTPGRNCPIAYRYSPRVFDREPEIVADTLYVVGGLYGNVEALDAVRELARREPGGATLVFNGDFHWFDVAPADEAGVVASHHAVRGNVETEVAGEDSGAGCGCAYPADVSDAVVSRSNRILARLRETARERPGARERLGRLPMHLVAAVGDARIGIVHGDATSLAGWGFASERLADFGHDRWIEAVFGEARVDAFASTHTCLPALRQYARGVVANNGAAGMPNFPGVRAGLATRIGRRPFAGSAAMSGARAAGAFIDVVPVEYDHDRWLRRFLAAWPAGSPAHDSYFGRIAEGPRAGCEA